MSDYGSDSYYFADRQRGGGGGAAAPATPSIHPSGGGGGGGGIRIAPGGGGGGGGPVSRPQKTQVLNHVQQTAVGGPGAPTPPHGIPPNPTVPSGVPPPTPPTPTVPPHPGMPGGGIGGGPQIHPGIGGEHQGPGIPDEHGVPSPGGGHRAPAQRDEMAHPDQFRDWDRRFDRDRDHLHADYWRTAFSDYDRDRFLPWLREDHLLWHIFGINYYPQYVNVGIPYYPVDCGTWVIGADGRWYLVSQSQLSIISQIESLRGIRRYRPVVIPCGWGGGWI